jgi:ABC-2 type transport system ATP-binding protein
MTERPSILEIEGLVKTYDTGQRAVDGLSLRVPAGSIFGFIGLNGAGKTTTIRIITGLLGRDAGSVRLFGRELRPDDPDMKRAIGVVLDEPLYFDWMPAAEYLRFVGVMEGLANNTAEQRAGELLHFFDLADRGQDPIDTYSTGMKKKVSLAAAVIHTPKLVILDEPLEGIDAVASSAIKGALAMMAARGTTIFITSHVMDTVERFCTDIAIIHKGKSVLECRTDEIRTRAKGDLPHATFASLEELFVETVSDNTRRRHLSFL